MMAWGAPPDDATNQGDLGCVGPSKLVNSERFPGLRRRRKCGPRGVSIHNRLPPISFPKRKGGCWVRFVCIPFVFSLQDYVLWLGIWELCFCGPQPESLQLLQVGAGVQATQGAFSEKASKGPAARAPHSAQGSLLVHLEPGRFPGPRAGSAPTF